jgi:TetR/AcrR family transcriptional regulator
MLNNSDTEQRILEAATAVFLLKGKDGARMQDIADRAHINKALLHYYFRSKDKLYDVVFKEQVSLFFRNILAGLTPQPLFEDSLRRFIDRYIDNINANRHIIRFMHWEIQDGGDRMQSLMQQVFADLPSKEIPLFSFIRDAVAAKQIRPVDPIHLLINILSLCVFVFIAKPVLEKVLPGLHVEDPSFLEQRKQVVFDLIWNGISFSTCGGTE